MQILSDIDTDVADSFLLTPQSSDSDFDDLLESDSLGERSTTSTVPTHNSSFPHLLSRLSFTNLTGLGADLDSRERTGMYSKAALLYLQRLVWASVAVAMTATACAVVLSRDELSQHVFYRHMRYQNRCRKSSSLCANALTYAHPFLSYLTTLEVRLLRKRKLLTHLLCSKYPVLATSFICRPPEYVAQIYLAFTTSLRSLLYTAGQIFAVVVALNLLSARTRTPALATVPDTVTRGRISDAGFTAADLELIPLLFAAGYIPWEAILLQFFRIYGVFDSYDRRGLEDGTKYLLLSGFWLRRVIAHTLIPLVKQRFNRAQWSRRRREQKNVRWKGLNEGDTEGSLVS
ncbi:hypothetical protein TWF696_005392 [Orbilia brochopaga]|uniref:Uncharacterized protein n=1 Tax=Orbilia brochopaga TaxID=3140254 RepID=A0AAV9V4J5_9PEZI